jgi:hypothetical protein
VNDSDQQTALTEIGADPRLAVVYEYWCTLTGDHDVPAFGRLDPVDLSPAVLPYVTLLDVIDGGRLFRVRLVGTGTTDAFGREATGTDLDEAAAGHILTAALERYRTVLAHRRPVLDIVEYTVSQGPTFKTRHLTVPFSTKAPLIDRLLGVYSPSSAEPRWILRDLVIPAGTTVSRSRTVL